MRTQSDIAAFKGALVCRIKTRDDAERFIRILHKADKLFHFDDSPETIEETVSGVRTFTDEECMYVRRRVAEMFSLPNFDPFELAVELSQ